jgi:hypothetical protein
MGEIRNSYANLVRKTKGQMPLHRIRRRLDDNIKMDLKDKIRLTKDRSDSCIQDENLGSIKATNLSIDIHFSSKPPSHGDN